MEYCVEKYENGFLIPLSLILYPNYIGPSNYMSVLKNGSSLMEYCVEKFENGFCYLPV